MATIEYVDSLRRVARDKNLALVMTPCCPVCQEYGKPQDTTRMFTVRVHLDDTVSKDGIMFLTCSDCVPEWGVFYENLQLWIQSGYAAVHYVDS